MNDRKQFTDAENESFSPLTSGNRWSGALLAGFGGLLTLVIGGALLLYVEATLSRFSGYHGWLPFDFLDIVVGAWLALPAGYAGYLLGFERTLYWLSHFWLTADPRRPELSVQLWAVLIISAIFSGQVVKTFL